MSTLTAHRADLSPSDETPVDIEPFRWFTGSYFVGLFAVALFDQAMHPAVSAALVETGRIRNDSIGRGLRSAASEQLMQWGDLETREQEAQRIRDLQRAVRGTAPDGTRYSALHPETWNLIMLSTVQMYRNAYTPITGRILTPFEEQAAYEHSLEMMERLQLPGSNRLPVSWEEALRWYDDLAETTLADTETLRDAIRNVRRPPMPDFLPRVATPAWWLIGPIAGHVLLILGIGIMRPRVRALTGLTWGRLQQTEFAVLTRVIQTANLVLPRRITYTPLAYNRWRYERLVAKYQALGLESFAPDYPALG